MKLFYKFLINSGTIIFLIFFLFILYFTYKIPLNNYRLMVFQNNFRKSIEVLHPNQSVSIAEAAEVGNWADGTYCEFIVGEFRSSPLSKKEIEKIYPYDFFDSGVYFTDEDIFNYSPWSEWKEKYLKNYKPKEGENVYLIWASNDDNLPNGDIRCE